MRSISPMCHKSLNAQRGSALVIAVFVITVMLLLTAALSNLLSGQSEHVSYEVYGVRAVQAAHAGAESRLASLFPLNQLPKRCNGDDIDASYDGSLEPVVVTNLTLQQADGSDLPGLENCRQVVLNCENFQVQGVTYFRIASRATCTVGSDDPLVISREVEVEAKTL